MGTGGKDSSSNDARVDITCAKNKKSGGVSDCASGIVVSLFVLMEWLTSKQAMLAHLQGTDEWETTVRHGKRA